jgi:hypothetical protein
VPLFSLEEARAELRQLLPVIDEFVVLRAQAAELGVSVQTGVRSEYGGLPEFKAAQARLDELLTRIQESGADVKGFAPLLLDFPAEYEGDPVLLCWLEGDRELAWYHRRETGFAGRRRLPATAD